MVDISDIGSIKEDSVRAIAIECMENAAGIAHKGKYPLMFLPHKSEKVDISNHSHPVPELFFQLKGKSILQGTDEQILLQPGTNLIIAPEVAHTESRQPDSVNLICKILGRQLLFHLSVASWHGKHVSLHACVNLGSFISPGADLADACHLVANVGKQDIALALIANAYSMLALLINESTQQHDKNSPLLKRCQEIVLNNLQDPEITVTTLAAKCGCHPDHLSRIAKRYWGMTIQRWLTTMRMERALLLLASQENRISEIARLCGYPDSHYFSRTFKKEYGQTPSAYRQAIADIEF